MKEVLVSLKPYYYYLVGEGIKKVEVRKSFPLAKDWNKKTYFYMSKDQKSFAKIPKEFQEKYRNHFGKVGLSFVCDRIIEYSGLAIMCAYYETNGSDVEEHLRYHKGTGLNYDEMARYSNGEDLYGLHISDLVIYDKPREIGEFFCKCNKKYCTGCEDFCDEGETIFRMCGGLKAVTRPPQSWQYVEEKENK